MQYLVCTDAVLKPGLYILTYLSHELAMLFTEESEIQIK